MSEIVPSGPPASSAPADVVAVVAQFEQALLGELAMMGLPSNGILVEVAERRSVFAGFPDVIRDIDIDYRGRALYLSKFIAAVGAGLFDAALNYLWDETVAELRRRIAGYDLAYFFDVAVTSPDRRKHLRTEDDLTRVEDQEMIRAAREMALISEVGFQQLDLIRYMRNHASAAHPNQNDIQAYQLLGFLQTCIREVITLEVSTQTAETRRLLKNVRDGQVDASLAKSTAEFFRALPQAQADNIAAGLFGIYVEAASTEPARDSVRLLFPELWPFVSEDQRQQLGLRFGRFVANGDSIQAVLARQLLDVAGAAAYLPDEVRTPDLAAAIEELLAAHRGFNNFHTEPGAARRLDELAGDHVPVAVRFTYVRALVDVFLTNISGVAWSADPHYRAMISRFDPGEAEMAVRVLFGEAAQSKLRFERPRAKYAELIELLDPKMIGPAGRELMDAMKSFSGAPSDLAKDSHLTRLLARITP